MKAKKKLVRDVQPWLQTAYDITKVLSVKENVLYLGNEPITDNQLTQLKSEAGLMARFTLWPILTETARKEAVTIGIVKSTEWDHVLSAKSMLVLLDWMTSWTETIRKVQQPKKT